MTRFGLEKVHGLALNTTAATSFTAYSTIHAHEYECNYMIISQFAMRPS